MSIVPTLNSILWNNILLYLLLFAGVWFLYKLRFIQFRHFTHMFTLLKSGDSKDKQGISSFQALMTSLAARVGTGNLAGVAIAISLGGPGAIFWMWLIAFLGMATGFAESLLGQAYKVKDANGEYRGGPAYYIRMGMKNPIMSATFSFFIFLGFGFIFSSVQANTMTDALNNSYQIPTWISGAVIVVAAAFILFGGVRLIAKWSAILVPLMGVGYIGIALFICAMNYSQVPEMLWTIVASALGLQEAAAGTLGAAIINGVKRGLYSNEAGAGTVPHAAACASPIPNHPATQGYIQMFGVFLDTIVICTATALIIMLAQGYGDTELTGIRLTQFAMDQHLGPIGSDFVLVAICLFSFTSIIANFVYAESNLHLFKLDSKIGKIIFTCLFLAMVYWGSVAALKEVWTLADLSLGMTTLINVIAIIILTPTVVALTKDYQASRDKKETPEFSKDKANLVQGELGKDIWK